MVPSRDRGGKAAGLARIGTGPAIARTNLEYCWDQCAGCKFGTLPPAELFQRHRRRQPL